MELPGHPFQSPHESPRSSGARFDSPEIGSPAFAKNQASPPSRFAAVRCRFRSSPWLCSAGVFACVLGLFWLWQSFSNPIHEQVPFWEIIHHWETRHSVALILLGLGCGLLVNQLRKQPSLQLTEFHADQLSESAQLPSVLIQGESIIWANPHFSRLVQTAPTDLLKESFSEFIAPRDREQLSKGLAAFSFGTSAEDRVTFSLARRTVFGIAQKDFGTHRYEARISRFSLENPDLLQLIIVDITLLQTTRQTLEHRNRMINTLYRLLQFSRTRFVRAVLLQKACQILVNDAGYTMVCFIQASDFPRVVPTVSYGDSTGFLEGLVMTLDDSPSGQSPVGLAFRTGESQFLGDISRAPEFTPWHDSARAAGFAGFAALPIKKGLSVLGVFALATRHPNYFTYDELAFLEEIRLQLSEAA